MGQAISTTQFALYGRTHFTRTGYLEAFKHFKDPLALDKAYLDGKVFMVTGGNSGIGFAVAKYLASKGGEVFIVCRNKERGEKAQKEIIEETQNPKVRLIVGDCGLRSDVFRIIEDFTKIQTRLDALVCNAGTLNNQKEITKEGVEVMFATHFLFGTYLLTNLAIPFLRNSPAPRVVVMSSGGAYNTAFPSWEIATSQVGKYDGQLAYCYAKRGQILLCEKWTEQYPDIKFVTVHPGWADTPGVEAAYGKSKKWLEPLRTIEEGSDGIKWLCIAPFEEIEGGEFYLDRQPQRKHLSGAFFSDGNFSKNSVAEVNKMMEQLSAWSALKGVTPPPPSL
eukprot:c12677_g1_i2.p1 GENE.c12677_g1_i2~~c12677_g1_i2.p1  ORF type:complete len:336 (+),score=157.46 c12677_g1_i2:59-1066(+)